MIQSILTYIALAVAVFFLFQKFFGRKKPSKKCGDNCKCH
jgi:hypothetical protein